VRPARSATTATRPAGRPVTFEDAARYIQKLPKAQRDLPHWQHAVEHLVRASAGLSAWLMFAEMGMLRAMNHDVERLFNTDRKETHWGKRKLKRET
jgi:hypothetical protein